MRGEARGRRGKERQGGKEREGKARGGGRGKERQGGEGEGRRGKGGTCKSLSSLCSLLEILLQFSDDLLASDIMAVVWEINWSHRHYLHSLEL